MDALDLLTADHNRVRGLFTRFAAAEDDTASAAAIVAKVAEELEVHTTIEEELFYPAIKGLDGELDGVVAEGVEEHHVAKMLLAEIKDLDPGAEEWTAKVKVLVESVEHHAEEEEQEMFKLVRKALDAAAREELGTRMEARKGELGGPTTADAVDLTVDELQRKAREQEIPGRSSMSRDELARTVDPRA